MGPDADARGIRHAKVPFTAVVLIPPEDTWEPIQSIRRAHDPQIARWMPHVTLLYPFVAQSALDRAAEALSDACAQCLCFAVQLAEFDCFIHGARSATVWLRPDPSAPVARLQSGLLEALPWCDDTSRFATGFTPHLSVGRWRAGEAQQAVAELKESWRPLEWRVDCVYLIARPDEGEAPFTVRNRMPLGGTPR